jgi:ATP-dependent helicase STH1/SNF2
VLLNFALPKISNSVYSFDEWFNTPLANSDASNKIELSDEEALLIAWRLYKVLWSFLLRCLKKASRASCLTRSMWPSRLR